MRIEVPPSEREGPLLGKMATPSPPPTYESLVQTLVVIDKVINFLWKRTPLPKLSTLLKTFPTSPPFTREDLMWLFTKKFYALGTHPEFGSGWSLINDCSLGVYDGVNITSKVRSDEERRTAGAKRKQHTTCFHN